MLDEVPSEWFYPLNSLVSVHPFSRNCWHNQCPLLLFRAVLSCLLRIVSSRRVDIIQSKGTSEESHDHGETSINSQTGDWLSLKHSAWNSTCQNQKRPIRLIVSRSEGRSRIHAPTIEFLENFLETTESMQRGAERYLSSLFRLIFKPRTNTPVLSDLILLITPENPSMLYSTWSNPSLV